MISKNVKNAATKHLQYETEKETKCKGEKIIFGQFEIREKVLFELFGYFLTLRIIEEEVNDERQTVRFQHLR